MAFMGDACGRCAVCEFKTFEPEEMPCRACLNGDSVCGLKPEDQGVQNNE